MTNFFINTFNILKLCSKQHTWKEPELDNPFGIGLIHVNWYSMTILYTVVESDTFITTYLLGLRFAHLAIK